MVASALTRHSGSLCDDTAYLSYVVCFCDIPESQYGLHMSKYSYFGLGFPKGVLVQKGANPVFYVAKNSWVPRPAFAETSTNSHIGKCEEFDAFWKSDGRLRSLLWGRGVGDEVRQLLELASIFQDFNVYSFIKFFDDELPEDDPENYYMEREWRTRGAVRFTLDDLAFVVLPEGYKRGFVEKYPELEARTLTV